MLRLLLILCLICSSAGLQILNQQYQVKTISTDGWNRVSVVLFQVEFDAPLAVGNLSLTSFNTTNTSSFVDLSMFDVSLPLNMATASLLGIPSLRCPWNYSFSSIPINSTLTEAQVIPVSSTADPVVGFFNSLDVQGATNFVAPMTVLERWFSAIFVLEDRRNCDAFAGCTFDTSGFGPILTDVNFSECTMTFNEGWSQQTNDTAFFLHAVGNVSDAFVNQSVTNFTVKELNDCNIAELEEAMSNFETATHFISGSTFEDLSASFWRALMFGMADPVLSCQLIMSDLLNETTFHGEAPTDRCLVLDPTNSSDPCCNKSLRFTSECCSERQTAYSFPSATVATTARQQLKDGQCKQRRLLLQSLQDFLISDVDNLNPATGCAATAQAIASQSVFDGYYSFVADCRNTVEVAMEPCTQGSDCISGKCFSYQCLPDYDSGFGGDAHTRCFAETMPEQVAAIAKVYLGIPGANQSTFVQQMEAQLWDYECNSYWLRSLLAYPNASTDFGFSVLALSEEQCDTFIVSCAYSNAIYLPSTCLNPPTWAVSNSSLQAGDAGICALCQGETCVPLLYGPRCAYEVFDLFSCIILGGVWDADFASDLPCTVPGIDNEADCLPVEFCPPQSDETGPFYQQVRCQDSYCISTAATNEADCASLATDQVHTIWNTSINNGTCITSEDSATCAAVGNVYWKGRVWRAALYNTPESCTAGACGINGIFNFGTDGANCVDYACTQTCSYCAASVSNSNFCFNSSISSRDACNTAGGTWAAEGFCYVSNQTEAGCLAAGLDWFDCKSIDNPDECAACTTPNCLALQCSWQYSVTCKDEEECVKYGGYCNDAGILSSLTSCPNETNPRAICASTCVIPPTLDAAGDPQCLLGLRAKIGCVDLDETTPETCKQRGGQIYNRAWNEESCLASGHGCSEEEFSDFYTQKNESQCTDCSGSWGPVFEWTPGQWRLETGYPFEWRPVEMVPYLHWQRMMNYTKLEEAVSAAAVLRTTLSLRSEAECLLNPLLSTLRLLACSCGNNSLADDTLYCQTVSNQVREIDLGSSLICSGISGSMRNGGFLISYNNNTIAQSYGCLEIEISAIPVVQFATKRQTPLSSLSLNNVGVHLSDNPYAVLENQHGRQIGQLISNGIDFKFLELDTTAPAQHKSGNSTNSTLANSNTTLTNSTPPITVNGLVVCFEQSTNVQHDQLFPVLDLAYLNGDSWDLIGANVSLMTDDSNRTYYCTTLSKGGQFAPVYRLNSTDLGAQLFSSVERGFILTLAGLFLFGFLLCTILVLLLLYIHGFKGFFRNLIFGKQLATMILVLLLLFSGIRGVWLLLVGTGVDNGNSEVAVDTVLTSLPIYIFFTLFTLLISFWASLWHEQFRLKKTALGRMKIPFLLINLAIYIFFTIIVVVYLRTDSSTNSDVNIIFQCTVAGIGFTILVLFLLYGILMFVTSYKLLNRAQTQSNAFFFRMTAVTLTCSLASLVQFIFLLLFTFNGFQKVFEALIYFFIVEVIPFYILLYLFFQPTKLSTTLRATYNRSSSMRSLPKLFSFKSTQRETVETTDPRTNTHTSEHE